MSDNAKPLDLRSGESRTDDELSGIGGWLILPPIHLAVDAIVFALLFVDLAKTSATAGTGSAGPSALALAASTIFFLFDAAVVVYALYCLVRFFQKKHQVPRLMIIFYSLVIAKAVVNLSLLLIFPDLVQNPDKDMFGAWKGVIQAVIAGAVWISYFQASVRVANTFTR
ncbi:MAG: DUF2569 domain-containing protein [Rhizomicrobium sp.]